MDNTRRMYLKQFCIILKNGAPERKARKVFSGFPQWDGFLKVLGVSDLTFLSYGCRKTSIELNGSSQNKNGKW